MLYIMLNRIINSVESSKTEMYYKTIKQQVVK
jgi:hypothetical protein